MKKYLTIDDSKGYPAGEYIYYECTKCEVVVYSYPINRDGCLCGNIEVNAMSMTVSIKDKNLYRGFEDR